MQRYNNFLTKTSHEFAASEELTKFGVEKALY